MTIPEGSDKLIDLLLAKMKNLSIGYKVSRNPENVPKKIFPSTININAIESEITILEETLKQDEMKNHSKVTEKLLELYGTAVEYYSAINDEKYELLKTKIQQLISQEVKLINISEPDILKAETNTENICSKDEKLQNENKTETICEPESESELNMQGSVKAEIQPSNSQKIDIELGETHEKVNSVHLEEDEDEEED